MMSDAVRGVGLALLIAWLGLWSHELHRAPASLGLTPDGSLPLLVIAVALFAIWLRAPGRPTAIPLLAYGLVGLFGAIVSVLPLAFLPFVPEQTMEHYAAHVVYAVLQLPLVVAAYRLVISPSDVP